MIDITTMATLFHLKQEAMILILKINEILQNIQTIQRIEVFFMYPL